MPKPSGPWILLNPGPVNVSNRVRRALLKPDICHREKEFSVVLKRVRSKLLRIFGIESSHTVAAITGSGTAALESMLCAYAAKQKKVLVLSNGVYGERIRHILKTYGCPLSVLSADLGAFPEAERIEATLKKDRSIQAIAMVHHETSSGMLNPLNTVGRLAKKYKKTFLVDAISSLGGEALDIRAAGIDYLAGTSGKCLHGFPGVSFVFISKREAARLQDSPAKSFYLDLGMTLAAEEKDDTPFTPAVQIYYAFEEALDELAEQGLAKRIASYARKSALLEKGFESLGLRFLVEKKFRSHVLTAVWTPSHIGYQTLHARLKKKGFIIYAGQSKLKDKIFRVSNLGGVSESDLRRFLSELKKILVSHGRLSN